MCINFNNIAVLWQIKHLKLTQKTSINRIIKQANNNTYQTYLKPLIFNHEWLFQTMVPVIGLEPTTCSLRMSYSTT